MNTWLLKGFKLVICSWAFSHGWGSFYNTPGTSWVFQTLHLAFWCLTMLGPTTGTLDSPPHNSESQGSSVFSEVICLFTLPFFCKCLLKQARLVLSPPVLGTKRIILKGSVGWQALSFGCFSPVPSRREGAWGSSPSILSLCACFAISGRRILLNVEGILP